MQQLTVEQLKNLSAKRLLVHYRSFSNILSNILYNYGRRCCEMCHEFIGSDEEWERDVLSYARPIKKYLKIVKSILNTKPHIPRKNPRKPNAKRIRVRSKTRGRGRFRFENK